MRPSLFYNKNKKYLTDKISIYKWLINITNSPFTVMLFRIYPDSILWVF